MLSLIFSILGIVSIFSLYDKLKTGLSSLLGFFGKILPLVAIGLLLFFIIRYFVHRKVR